MKDYTNSDIINSYNCVVHIVEYSGRNGKNETLWKYICTHCGRESEQTIYKIKKIKGCKFCKAERIGLSGRLSLEFIQDEINKKNNNVVLLDNYTTKDDLHRFKCKKHNIEFKKKFTNILYSENTLICPICTKEALKESNQKYIIKDIEDILKNKNYTWLNKDDYINASSILKCKCNKCGYKSKFNICNLLQGRKCKKCSGYAKKTTQEFKDEIFNLVENDYSALGEYINGKTKILMKHNLCNTEWLISPSNFIRGRRCPNCTQSKGEKEIEKYLLDKEINFIKEYSFDDCLYIRKLRFDFYLPQMNICIEFQGKQHYVSVMYMGGIEDYKKRLNRDKIKRDYCKNKNIKLIEIKYNEIDIVKDILDNNLFQLIV